MLAKLLLNFPWACASTCFEYVFVGLKVIGWLGCSCFVVHSFLFLLAVLLLV
jgi:hypothetical protein